jgi:anti-sigma factor RsiW
MMILHPSRGALRSYHDRQLSERRARDVARHLERCARCGARLEEIGTQAQQVRELFEALEVESVPLREVVARGSATAGLERAPFGAWGWFSRPVALPVPAWISLGLALVLFGAIVGTRPRMAPDVQPPAAEGRLVVVAQRGPSGRESRTLSLNEGNYRFIETPTVYTSP